MSGQVFDAPPSEPRERVIVKQVAKSGVGMGSALAIAISWSVNKSIVWAIIHGVFGWFYVAYYAIKRD